MSTTTINFQVTIDDAATDVDSVVLEDPTGTYGVIRKDTSAVVVAAGVALVKQETGEYEYEFTDPEEGLAYRYYVKVTIGQQIHYYERDYSLADSAISLVGRYSSSAYLFNKFGQDNILAWSRFSDSEVEATITARIQAALDYADEYVDGRLRGGPYVLPFYSVPLVIADIATVITGVFLYESRGIEDFVEGETVGRLANLKALAENQLGAVRTGRMRLVGMTGNYTMESYAEPMSTYEVPYTYEDVENVDGRIVTLPD